MTRIKAIHIANKTRMGLTWDRYGNIFDIVRGSGLLDADIEFEIFRAEISWVVGVAILVYGVFAPICSEVGYVSVGDRTIVGHHFVGGY